VSRLTEQALKDAFIATRDLGFRFLWINTICIVQDDEDDWNREVLQMQSIYANAAITLSDLRSENPHQGLFQSRQPLLISPVQISTPLVPKRRFPLMGSSWEPYYFVYPVQGEKHAFKPRPVHSQAWTLQEQTLSTRILH